MPGTPYDGHPLGERPEKSLPTAFQDWANTKAAYRFFADFQLRLRRDGRRLSWGDWYAEHVVRYSRGGTTTVSNGQVACTACNGSKGNAVHPVWRRGSKIRYAPAWKPARGPAHNLSPGGLLENAD